MRETMLRLWVMLISCILFLFFFQTKTTEKEKKGGHKVVEARGEMWTWVVDCIVGMDFHDLQSVFSKASKNKTNSWKKKLSLDKVDTFTVQYLFNDTFSR